MSRPPLHHRIAHGFTRVFNSVGDAWSGFVSPFERFFGRLGEGVFGVFDSFSGLEALVIRVVGFLFWPVFALGRLIGSWLPVGGLLAATGRPLQRLGSGTLSLAERLNLDGVLLLLAKLLKPIWWPIASVLGFSNAWLATRRPREIALGATAVLLAAPFAYVAIQGALFGRADVAERYKIAVRDAVEEGEYAQVTLYERKLAQLGVDTRRRDHRTALTLEEKGDLLGAYERMKLLAPIDRPGYPGAHAWIVQRLLSNDLSEEHESALADDPTAGLRLAEQHLDHLDTLKVAGPGIAQLRSFVYARTDRLAEAAEALAPHASSTREAAAMRMRLLTQLRDQAETEEQATIYLDLLRQKSRRRSDTRSDFESWALAAEILRDNKQMLAALSAWHEAEPDEARPRDLLALYRREQSARMLRDPTTSPVSTAATLIEAVKLGSPAAWINEQAQFLATNRARGRHVASVWDRLAKDAETPASLLEALGTAAAGRGDFTVARPLLEAVTQRDTDRVVAWNNYAFTLVQEPNPDPAAALAAISRALELKPGDYRFRETRGQILVALGRWDEAILDLEHALNGLPESTDVHRLLAQAYDALDKPQLAELHRQQASR